MELQGIYKIHLKCHFNSELLEIFLVGAQCEIIPQDVMKTNICVVRLQFKEEKKS